MSNLSATARKVFLILFLSCYLIGSIALMMNYLEPYHNYMLLAGCIFLVLYFLTFCLSYFSIKRRRKVNGYS